VPKHRRCRAERIRDRIEVGKAYAGCRRLDGAFGLYQSGEIDNLDGFGAALATAEKETVGSQLARLIQLGIVGAMPSKMQLRP
jgi:hypothetical protein